MEKNTIIAIILLVISLASVMTSISAAVVEVESQPTNTNFTISQGNSTNVTSLVLNIISPANKTYINKDVPIVFNTNKPAYCSYKIDNESQINLGLVSSFSKTIHFLNGNHNLEVKCNVGNESITKQISFKVNKKVITFSNFESDKTYEDELRGISYGEWMCINNKLQRSVIQYNSENIEYGQPCGFVLDNESNKVSMNAIFWYLIIIILVILILIAIVIIAMFLANSR